MHSKFIGCHLGFFSLPVWLHSSIVSPIGKLDPENIGIAVEIPLITCLEAKNKIHAFECHHLGFFHFQFSRIVFS